MNGAFLRANIFLSGRYYARSSHRITPTETSNIDTIAFSRFVVLRSRTKSMFHASIHESTSLSTDNEDTSSTRGLARGGLTPLIYQRVLNHVFLLTTHMHTYIHTHAHALTTKRSISRNQTYICTVPYTVITRGRQSLKRSIILHHGLLWGLIRSAR